MEINSDLFAVNEARISSEYHLKKEFGRQSDIIKISGLRDFGMESRPFSDTVPH